jgi:hypothetical protein
MLETEIPKVANLLVFQLMVFIRDLSFGILFIRKLHQILQVEFVSVSCRVITLVSSDPWPFCFLYYYSSHPMKDIEAKSLMIVNFINLRFKDPQT